MSKDENNNSEIKALEPPLPASSHTKIKKIFGRDVKVKKPWQPPPGDPKKWDI